MDEPQRRQRPDGTSLGQCNGLHLGTNHSTDDTASSWYRIPLATG